MRVHACDVQSGLRTIGKDLGLVGGAEANVMENEERQARAAPVLELAHLRQQVQAAVEPQDHLPPILCTGHIQEQPQPENSQAAETLTPSFRQRERQEVLQEVSLRETENITFFLSLHSSPGPTEAH